MCLTSVCPLGSPCRRHGAYAYVCFMYIFLSLLFQDCRRSGVSGEMDFLSAWIVSSSALPFLCLIWGKRIKCHFGTIIAVAVAFSSPICVQTIQLSWEPPAPQVNDAA